MSKASTKTAAITAQFRDCHGLAFDDVRAYMELHFGLQCKNWPTVETVKDEKVCRLMHALFTRCWNCGGGIWAYGPVQSHHIIGGTKGRSDELCNIAMLCGECHAEANTARLPMGRILALKWTHDRQHCDWVRLSRLHRKFLPDLITD